MLTAGAEIGRYRVETLLGAGGMGEVYRAFDTVLRRHVALKVLRADLPDAAARLLREARAAAGAGHPGAVAIFDIGETEGTSYIAMELVAGASLRDYVGRADVPLSRRLKWLADIARVLGAAHQKGFVHRDVKPENVMIATDDSVKVLDFGIAKRTGDERPTAADEPTDGPLSYRTQEGKVTGTPRYMAPEQLRGEPLDGRTDQYAWGAMAYELVSGVHPRAAGSATIEMLNHRIPEIPFELAAAVSRALAPSPDLRFPTMEDVAQIVDRVAREPFAHDAFAPVRDEAPTRPHTTAKTRGRALVRLTDVDGPRAVRLGWPLAAAATIVLGGTVMMVARTSRTVSFVGFLVFDAAVLFAYLRPLLSRQSKPATAEIACEPGALRLSHAGTRNQVVRRATGASLVADADRASLVVARSEGEPAIVLDFPDPAAAASALVSLGVEATPFGTVRWSLGRGPAEVLAWVLGALWRAAWVVALLFPRTFFPWSSSATIVTATLLSVASALVYFVYPRSGPFVALSPAGITIGHRKGPPRFVARNDVAAVTSEGASLVVVLWSGERVAIDARPGPLSSRGLDAEGAALVARHLAQLASVTRTEPARHPTDTSEDRPSSPTSAGSMLTGDELQVGDRTERDGTRRTV